MRINIFKNMVDGEYLIEEAEKFGSREALRPYLIMNQQTLYSLMKEYKKEVVESKNGEHEFNEYKILLNSELDYGEVDIR